MSVINIIIYTNSNIYFILYLIIQFFQNIYGPQGSRRGNGNGLPPHEPPPPSPLPLPADAPPLPGKEGSGRGITCELLLGGSHGSALGALGSEPDHFLFISDAP